MKTIVLITALIISQAGFTQPKVKLYGYSREFIPGMVPQRDVPDENGGQSIKRPPVTVQYYVFTSSLAVIQPKEIWLAGHWYDVAGSELQSTPVLSDDAEKKQLVPSTNLKVMRIDRGDTINSNLKITPVLKKMIAANELVISYLWNGKKYYTALKKLFVLAPFHAE